jgi:DNA polymerase III subunit gamma/tau
MSQSDYRWDLKYRPRRFDQVLGNKGVISLLLKRSRDKTLSDQSMLLSGPKGCGKTTLARLIVRAIICPFPQNGEPCGECAPCETVIDGSWGSTIMEMDAASQGSVDRVREIVRESDYETLDGVGHIYIIDEAQRLTPQAQDAFLKSIEERLLIVILCTTEAHKMRGPLRSRVEEYPISPPPADEITSWLQQICQQEKIEADSEALKVIAKMNDCCPRTSVLSLERLQFLGPITMESTREFFHFNSYELIDKVLFSIDSSPAKAFSLLDELASSESPTWIRDSIVAAIASGMRADVGAKSTFPVPIRFYQTRLHRWLELAKILGAIDRPNMPDIEASLLMNTRTDIPYTPPIPVQEPPANASSPSLPSLPPKAAETSHAPSVPVSLPKASSAPPKVIVTPPASNKHIEIDGVRFSSAETLTTLDSKVSNFKTTEMVKSADTPPVELDQSHAPIPEKEFIRGIVSRLKART